MTRLTGDWLSSASVQTVLEVLESGSSQVFVVGGCIRNALLGQPVNDIDIATDLPPKRVMALGHAANLKVVPTGVDHGTVTLVHRGQAFEVTTFRRDVTTDGRHAEVAFGTELAEDARRRDFTMNALYADRQGRVLDPLDGLADLQARHVRFVGDAVERITEDYLRSLRFFRFYAWYGDPEDGPDAEALAAIASNLDGLAGLSAERITAELVKLLQAPDPAPAVAAMRSTGVLGQLLAGCDDRFLAPLVLLEAAAGQEPNAERRLAVLGAPELFAQLRLSRKQNRRIGALSDAAVSADPAAVLGYRLGYPDGMDALLIRCALMNAPWQTESAEQIQRGAHARFPVQAKDLMDQFKGPDLGGELDRLERLWIGSEFTLDKAELLGKA